MQLKNLEGSSVRNAFEVDFVANKGGSRYYIQSALTVASEEKRLQKTASLHRINDSFPKIVVVKEPVVPWHDERGVLYVGVEGFLLDQAMLGC